jgi:DNA end-binding protein Ku
MRSMWKGAVSFGLVSIGVKMYSATEEKDVSFHQVRRSDGSRIRYRRVAEADGEEVQYADIAKGYTLDTGETIILTDADFADLPLPTTRTLDVLQFVPLEQVDPIYFNKSYFLEPEKTATKPYVLLRDALERSDMVALVKVAIRTREQLATLRVRDGVIVLETMLWPDEIRTPDFAFLDEDVQVRAPEQKMADSLVASMAGDFDAEEYTDEYRAALQQVIDAKAEGRDVVDAPADTSSGPANVVDLMAALRASVDAAKARRGEGAADSGSTAATSSAGKATAKAGAKTTAKAPAKKAAKKAPAKKVAAASKTAAKSATKSTAKSTSKSTAKSTARSTARSTAKKTAAKTTGKTAEATRRSA